MGYLPNCGRDSLTYLVTGWRTHTISTMKTHGKKACSVCKEEKGVEQFYVHAGSADGLYCKCRACARKHNKEYRQRNLEAVRARERARDATPERKAYLAAYQIARRELQLKKYAARTAVKKAVYHGTLIRKPCEVCGDPKSEAHHPDYDKPLCVDWLCRLHHAERHAQERLVKDEKEGA